MTNQSSIWYLNGNWINFALMSNALHWISKLYWCISAIVKACDVHILHFIVI